MSENFPVLPVIGTLYQPSSTSGIHFPTCTHQAPQSCEDCDGTRPWKTSTAAIEVTPPCMRKEEK